MFLGNTVPAEPYLSRMGVDQQARNGEELNTEALAGYLAQHLPGFSDLASIQQYRSGYSNLTYELTTNLGKSVLRRPPFGPRHGSAHDMLREHKLLQGISTATGQRSLAPTPLLVCADEEVLGAPFYLMEHVSGPIIRRTAKGAFPDLNVWSISVCDLRP